MVQLSPDSDMHFEILRDISAGVYGGGDVGEILTAANQIQPGNFESYYCAFNTLANSVHTMALNIDSKKHPVSARDAFFRASTYYQSADFFLHGDPSDPRIDSLWALRMATFDSAQALLPIPGKRINITTASGFYVPAIYYKAPGPVEVQGPTIIIGGGYDGGQEELYHQVAKAALERGWNAITYEGPGQASVVRYQNLGFIIEWEKVVTPVVDYLFTLPEVDTSRIALFGYSFGGLLAPRASAFEKRLVATAALDGLPAYGSLFLERLPKGLVDIFNTWNKTAFDTAINKVRASAVLTDTQTQFRWFIDQGTWTSVTTSPFDWLTDTQTFKLDPDVIAEIPGPIFVADSKTDTFFVGEGKKLADMLGDRSTYYEFDVASGVGHAGVGGYVMQNQVSFDWVQEIFDKL
jgi:dienelactone hydrolase